MAWPWTFANLTAGNQAASKLDDNFNAAAPLASPALTGVPTAPTPALSDNSTTIASTAFVQGLIASIISSGATRQTVSSGPVDGTTGLANFLPATSINLNLTSQNVTSSAPLIVTAANGASAAGSLVNRSGYTTANLTWAGLTASQKNYLYVTVGSDATLTTGFTIVPPVYQWGGTPSVTSGQITFNIGSMQCYLGNGATALSVYLVLVGEADAGVGTVTATAAYAYNGQYESKYTNTLPAGPSITTVNHNIGVVPSFSDFRMQCLTAESGYAIGDEMGMGSFYNNDGAVNVSPVVVTTKNTISFSVQSFYAVNNKTAPNSRTGITLANWKYKFVARRGW